MAPVRVAIVGAGIWSQTAHLPAIEAAGRDLFDIVAIYSRSAKSGENIRSQIKSGASGEVTTFNDSNGGLDALLARKDIDAVVIALPIGSQAEAVSKAHAAGKHVLSEKPLAASFDEAKQLLGAFEKKHAGKGQVWQVEENYAHEPAFYKAKEILKSGKIGKLAFVEREFLCCVTDDNPFANTYWRADCKFQGGFAYDGGVHHAAGLTVSLGEKVKSISSFSTSVKLKPVDTCHVIFETESGARGTWTMSFGSSETDARNYMIITGTDGHIRVTGGGLPEGMAPGVGWHASESYHVEAFNKDGRFFDEWYLMDGVNVALKVFAKAVQGTATKEELEAASPRRAMEDVTFSQGAIESNGNLLELAKIYAF